MTNEELLALINRELTRLSEQSRLSSFDIKDLESLIKLKMALGNGNEEFSKSITEFASKTNNELIKQLKLIKKEES